MKAYFDLHTHTIASGHAYSTLQENAAEAGRSGLIAVGMSDHDAGLPGAPDNIYFSNLKIIPRMIGNVLVLRGAEVNIVDYEGSYRLNQRWAAGLDYLIASLHNYVYTPGTPEQNTAALLGAIKNPYVRVIGHPDDSRFPIEFEPVIRAAAEAGVLIELNNSSLLPQTSRIGTHENDLEILRLCREYGAKILIGSDAHVSFAIGKFDAAFSILEETGFPEELVVNAAPEGLLDVVHPDRRDEIRRYL